MNTNITLEQYAPLVEQADGNARKLRGLLMAEGLTDKQISYLVQESGLVSPRGGKGGTTFRSEFWDAIVANPEMTAVEAIDFINDHELSSNNVRKHMSTFMNEFYFAQRLRATLKTTKTTKKAK